MNFKEFFTLPLLKEDAKGQRYILWQVDQKLQNYINNIVCQKTNLGKSELVKIILDNFKDNPQDKLNRLVWTAFLAKFSYQAALKTRTNLVKISRQVYLDFDSLFLDLFQIALGIALSPEKCLDAILKHSEYENLEPNIWYFKFKKYISKRIEGLLCDNLREIEGLRTYQRSELGLAARVTKTRVTAALKHLGMNEITIAHYTLAWQCFKEAKDSGIINISSPQAEAFTEIYRRYQQLSQQLPKFSPSNQRVDGSVMHQWLQEIGKSIRNYIDFTQVSLDQPISQDSETLTWVDVIPDETSIVQKDMMSAHEIEEAVNELREFIDNTIDNLKPEEQRIPLLLHGLDLSQEKVGIELGANQSTVGRRYKKVLMDLLSQLGIWANEHLRVALDSEKLNELKIYLQECLDVFYHLLMYKFLLKAIQILEFKAKEIMRLFWIERLEEKQIAELLNSPIIEVNNQLLLSQKLLLADLRRQIENRINLPLNSSGIACNQLSNLMKQWLKTAPLAAKN
jgi:RNA polymerase sigma factor (sigma-70 family)